MSKVTNTTENFELRTPKRKATDESRQKAQSPPVRYLREKNHLRNKTRGSFEALLFFPSEARYDEGPFPKPRSLSRRYDPPPSPNGGRAEPPPRRQRPPGPSGQRDPRGPPGQPPPPLGNAGGAPGSGSAGRGPRRDRRCRGRGRRKRLNPGPPARPPAAPAPVEPPCGTCCRAAAERLRCRGGGEGGRAGPARGCPEPLPGRRAAAGLTWTAGTSAAPAAAACGALCACARRRADRACVGGPSRGRDYRRDGGRVARRG